MDIVRSVMETASIKWRWRNICQFTKTKMYWHKVCDSFQFGHTKPDAACKEVAKEDSPRIILLSILHGRGGGLGLGRGGMAEVGAMAKRRLIVWGGVACSWGEGLGLGRGGWGPGGGVMAQVGGGQSVDRRTYECYWFHRVPIKPTHSANCGLWDRLRNRNTETVVWTPGVRVV